MGLNGRWRSGAIAGGPLAALLFRPVRHQRGALVVLCLVRWKFILTSWKSFGGVVDGRAGKVCSDGRMGLDGRWRFFTCFWGYLDTVSPIGASWTASCGCHFGNWAHVGLESGPAADRLASIDGRCLLQEFLIP